MGSEDGWRVWWDGWNEWCGGLGGGAAIHRDKDNGEEEKTRRWVGRLDYVVGDRDGHTHTTTTHTFRDSVMSCTQATTCTA